MIEIVAPFSGGIGYLEKTCYGNNKCEEIEAYGLVIRLSYMNPAGDTILAPADGIILAINIESDEFLILLENGMKLLVQFDVKVVEKQLQVGFTLLVAESQQVDRGEPIIKIYPGYLDDLHASRYSTLIVYEPDLIWHVVSHQEDVVAGETVILYLDLESPCDQFPPSRCHAIYDFDSLRTRFILGRG